MKKVIIIGAGIAGLSAGSYLQKNGYETEIFEMSSRPGGLCASWKRGDYLIDGCINWGEGYGRRGAVTTDEVWWKPRCIASSGWVRG